jgi:ABC-2 type transport system ATP-binding protein
VPAVAVEGLVKRYGATTAVDGVSFAVAAGTVLALLGPNGAGKTTTVETCEGFRTPDAGSVRVLGLDPVRDHATLAPRVGVMLQSGGVYPGAYPLEMLRLVASFHADARDPGPLLERLGVPERTTYRRLSGGQQQRLSLALAIVGRPEVVFLDEPTAGLDPDLSDAFVALIQSLHRELGLTVVMVTHDLDTLFALSTRIAVLAEKHVIAVGPTRDVLKVDHPFIKQFFLGARGQRALEVLDEHGAANESEN